MPATVPAVAGVPPGSTGPPPRDAGGKRSSRIDTAVRIGLLVGLTLVAYQHSFRALMGDLGAESPLAYTGLVPLIAALVAVTRAGHADDAAGASRGSLGRRLGRRDELLIGIGLVALATLVNIAMSLHLSTIVWAWRLDVVSMVLFVAGCTIVLFGAQAAWRQRFAIALLLLAWPLPYTLVLVYVLGPISELTAAAAGAVVGFLGFATPVAGTPTSFSVHSHPPFVLDIAAACSGISGVVGFLLVGTAFGAVTRGPAARRALWLTLGLVVLWTLNLARIAIIFGVGATWGYGLAIDWFHPYLGLITFNIGVVVMLLTLRPLGLRLSISPAEASASAVARRPALWPAVAIVCVLAVVGALGNRALIRDDLTHGVDARVQQPSFASMTPPPGWTSERGTGETWAHPHLGPQSTWNRFALTATTTATRNGDRPAAVTADVLSAHELGDLGSFGSLAIARSRGHLVRDVHLIDLGGGVRGQFWSYVGHPPTLSWIWPLRATDDGPRYEQITLSVPNGGLDDGSTHEVLASAGRALVRASRTT